MGKSFFAILLKELKVVRVYFDKENLIVEADNIFDKVLVYDISGKLITTLVSGKRKEMIEKSQLYNGVNLINIIFADKIVNKEVISK